MEDWSRGTPTLLDDSWSPGEVDEAAFTGDLIQEGEDASTTSPERGGVVQTSMPDEQRSYGATMRTTPLLKREQEQDLGRLLTDTRKDIVDVLSEVPLASQLMLASLHEAVERKRPLTDVLLSPLENIDLLEDHPYAPSRTYSTTPWRRVTEQFEYLYEDWCNQRYGQGAAPVESRQLLAQAFRNLRPGTVVINTISKRLRELEREGRLAIEASSSNAAKSAVSRTSTSKDKYDRATTADVERLAGTNFVSLCETNRRVNALQKTYESARTKLIESNLRLAYYVAHQVKQSRLPLEDLIQEAMLGLMRAVEKFDYTLGYKFSTYAVQWIWQSVTRILADQSRTVRVAAHTHDAILRVSKTAGALEQRMQRKPTPSELAFACDLSEEEVTTVLEHSRSAISFDAPLQGAEETSLHDLIADEDSRQPVTRTEKWQAEDRIMRILGDLPEREAMIIRLHYGIGINDPLTLEQVGSLLGITRERARQIEARALSRIRQANYAPP